MTTTSTTGLAPGELATWHRDGFHVERGLFAAGEIDAVRERFDALAARGESIPGHWTLDPDADDLLGRYPRVMQPHDVDPASLSLLLEPRLQRILTTLMGEDVVACQSMYYFKPPGARGQAFHQDNYYLRVEPLTCVAAWIAVDRSHPDNGGLQVCPGTHTMAVDCPEEADPTTSIAREYVAPPPGHDPVKLELEPGDVLFFTGSVVHGSNPNLTDDEWRRSFICHYLPASATHIAQYYLPHMYDFAGNRVAREAAVGGGPCGTEHDVAMADGRH
ncbi:phytanoyl-CoA dioxygenase family protein [Propionibacteriaceae bacterium Y2011]|uniref:phytanoyl-CoA dioxygenase family protein n=1 Tax=Microlunatus sp. Y2014 TaxID=3418488 RepID=UPI003B464986